MLGSIIEQIASTVHDGVALVASISGTDKDTIETITVLATTSIRLAIQHYKSIYTALFTND
jgi:hypothetical protein